MNTIETLTAFSAQIERHTGIKVVLTPTSVAEKGVIVKISLLKSYAADYPRGFLGTRQARVRVSVCGTAESFTGLQLAVEAIESLDSYLLGKGATQTGAGKCILLEDETGSPIPNSRILTTVSAEDSFIDSPDSTAVQDVQDDRTCIITFPWEVP